MGLDLTFKGRLKRKIWGNKLSQERLERILQCLAEKFEYGFARDDEDFLVEFCPTGVLNMNLVEGKIKGHARTSVAGPGFHKAVVDFLDVMATRLELDLLVEDDTSYWDHRDFDDLRAQHHSWLKAVTEYVRSAEQTNYLISWPIGSWRPFSAKNVATPMGDLTFEELDKLLGLYDGIEEFASEYFIWYNPDRDALFHRGAALYLMWNDFHWVETRMEDEVEMASRILYHLGQARKLDSHIALPLFAWKEVSVLSGLECLRIEGPDFKYPFPIGYRRRDVIISLPGEWQVKLPGSFRSDEEDEGFVYWDVDRNFRLTAYRGAGEEFVNSLARPDMPGEKSIDHEAPGLRFKAKYYLCGDNDEPEYWILRGQILGQDKMCIVTITWLDQKWTDWAIQTFKDVHCPKPNGTHLAMTTSHA